MRSWLALPVLLLCACAACPVGGQCGQPRGAALAAALDVSARIFKIARQPNATLLSADPPIVLFDGLLSDAESKRIVRITESELAYSATQGGVDRSVTNKALKVHTDSDSVCGLSATGL